MALLKNVIAIGAGMITGKEYGINTMAAYLTRASQELSTLCVAMAVMRIPSPASPVSVI